MASSSSSSTSFIKKSYQYDVFLSFSGEDTRKNFVDHLYEALKQHGIYAFKDDERLKQGKSISDQLLKSIEDSRLYIIIFSKKYASSSWCLNELVKIMECQKSNEQIAYPVFYDVDPSEVRKQRGPVGEALAKHTNIEIGKWGEALTEAANLSGWDLRNTADGHEAKVIKLIIERISLELGSINVNLDDKLVGMESRLRDFEKSLDIASNDVHMIGIKGMGGAGKSTLAGAVFDRIAVHYEAKSFVENVREVSKVSPGLLSLQKKILSDLLIDQGSNVSSVHEGTNMMKKKLRDRKVLVVLDDVDHKDQLEALAGDLNWFKRGSTIIITTRDEQVLIAHEVKWICDVKLLSDEEAIGLFSRYAFGKDIPIKEYEKQSFQVVRYAAGLPLTIKVLGSFLCGKAKHEWTDALARLSKIPLKETTEKLEISFEGLESDYKEIFLDIACLLKGWEKNKAIRMLESCGFHAKNGLRVLEQRSLITFRAKHLDFYVSMHDNIEEMGKNIVRRLHPHEPDKHSRLWIQEEIEDVLSDGLDNEATRCLNLKLTPEIICNGLGNMKKLRVLIVNYRENTTACDDLVKIEEFCQYFPKALRYLNWHYYPHCRLPETFQANNLVALEMYGSGIEQLWVGGKAMRKLKYIDLSFSHMRTLNLGLTPNLVRLDLQSCFDLEELHVPVGCLKTLVYLDLGQCERLKSIQFIKDMESLEVLNLNGLHLTEFPDIIPSHSNSRLQLLNFCDNDIENLPSLIGNLHRLVYLYLTDCVKLKSLPGSICSLQHLNVLDLQRCGIEELPENIGQLECLVELDLTDSKVKYLPNSICMLKHLKILPLSRCRVFDKLPKDLGQLESLELLNIKHCKIREIPRSICKLKHLKNLDLDGCDELEKLPENLEDLECLKNREILCLTDCKITEIPSSICKLKHLKTLYLDGCDELEKLPENLGDIESLERNCKITEIPSSICKLKHLKTYLDRCDELQKLPENLGDIECLKKLCLRNCKITEIPSSICKLKHLKTLYLDRCDELEKLPENLGDIECLEILCLRKCKITEIPSSICKLKHLKTLDLDGCDELKKLPENLGDIECLEKLDLTDCKITEFPSSICKLKHLKTLDLDGCDELEKLPENLGDIECLEKLWLLDCKITEIPSSICKLKHLNVLGLNGHDELDKLPENLGDIECLEMLYLENCKITEIPSSICKLKHLNVLGLQGCDELEKLPENLGDIECLEILSLINCKITEIPSIICKLKHLKTLCLDRGDELEKLLENLGNLECLKKLDLTGCKITEIPSSICKLKHLKTLDLDGCDKLEKLPENLGDLECLKKLDLTGCKITEIPSSICKLKHLKTLDLDGCDELEKLPENLGDLECLKKLDLTGCKITEIPSSICKLKHLETLNLEGCEVRHLPKDFGQIESLNYLSLSYSKIRHIPSSICKLKHLKELDLSNCSKLKKLPENLGDLVSLEKLNLKGTWISHLPHSISLLKGLEIIGYEKWIDPYHFYRKNYPYDTCSQKEKNQHLSNNM